VCERAEANNKKYIVLSTWMPEYIIVIDCSPFKQIRKKMGERGYKVMEDL